MAKERQSERSRLTADSPITNARQDELGRLPFAESLARTISRMKGQDSFVFGLCGRWGSGKSSVLKLVLRELEKGRSKRKPVVLDFNPWWFSGRDQLLQAFLAQLDFAIGRQDTGARTKKLGKRLAAFSKILRPFSLIPGARLASEFSDVLDKAGEATISLGEQLSADVHRVREQIDEILRNLGRRVVIVMDDLDRLTAGEIAQLFLIVKAVADFPNTVYLLAFDQDVVAKAISDTLQLDGVSYLEKIVQVQIDIPVAGPITLQQMFLRQLEMLIRPEHINQTTRHDFACLFHDGITSFFQTPRSAKRLANVLRVLYPAVEGEVYWPDFVGVISLMVFAPAAFRAIRDNPTCFTGSGDIPSGNPSDEQTFHREWTGQLPEESRTAITDLVCRLFPRVSAAIKNRGFSREFEVEWRDRLRVCATDIFPRYFQLCVPVGEISEAEWAQIIGLLDSSPDIDARISQLCQERGPHGYTSRGKEFLERVSVYAKCRANPDEAKSLFQVVLRNGDALIEAKDEEARSLMSIGNDLRVSWAMQAALLRIEDKSEREAFLEASMGGNIGLYTAAHFVWFLGEQHGNSESSSSECRGQCHASEACVDRLRTTLLTRIATAAREGTLAQHPKSLLIAREWRTFGHEAEARQWVEKSASDDQVLVDFIGQVHSIGHSQGLGDRVAREHHRVDADYLGTWFDLAELRRRCSALVKAAPGWLSADRQYVLQLLLDTVSEDGTVLSRFDRKRRSLIAGERKPSA